MDTSTLLVVFLLITAASLASYALSHWSSIRGTLGAGWAATSIGTVMLLVAAAIVVLTFVFRGPLWRPNLGTAQQLRENAAASTEISARPVAAAAALPTGLAPASPTARASVIGDGADGSPAASIGGKSQTLKAATTPSTSELDPQPLRAFKDDDPWAATGCVHVYHPGSDTTRWHIENGCDVPVGIVISTCADNTQACWKYPDRPLIFPAKLQRPIPLEEQTVHGRSVRHVACFVATSAAKYLIGAPSEERSSPAWREQFESVRVSDGCLSRVQSATDEGRRTRLPVDIVTGYGKSVP